MQASLVIPDFLQAIDDLASGRTGSADMPFAEYIDQMHHGFVWGAHHRLLARCLELVEEGAIDRLIFTLPPRHGKALALDTPIPTPSGWTTMGELRVGDWVFDETGAPTQVVGVSPIWRDREVYRVSVDSRHDIVADAEHEWLVRLDRKRPVFKRRTTRELAGRTSPRAPMAATAGSLDLPDTDLPIPPYILGVWLGDGDSAGARITCPDQEIIDRCAVEGGGVRMNTPSSSGCPVWSVGAKYGRGAAGDETMHGRLRAMGLLGNKHVPDIYMRGSAEQRRALLQGLIDTDGHVATDGQVEFCSTSERLAMAVHELVASLGGKATILSGRAMLYGKDCGPKWRVCFYLAGAASLPRKAERTRSGDRASRHYLTFAPAGRADTVCIEVAAPSHLFLAGRAMVPTCNSATASVLFPAWFLGRNPDAFFISACHTQELANVFSEEVRGQVGNPEWPFTGVSLRPGSQGVKSWRLAGRRGRYQTTGVGGSPAGRGGHVVLIDDPVKSKEAADSPVWRDKTWRWFNSDIYTRLQPGAAVILVSTLWHEDDLTGRLVTGMRDGTGERYDWVHLPAVCRDAPQAGALVPGSDRWRELFTEEDDKAFGVVEGNHDPVGRLPGAPLWPAWYGTDALARIRQQLERDEGGRAWMCLYQGVPTPPEGTLFRREFFQNRYGSADHLDVQRIFLFVDSAYKTGVSNSYSSIAVWALVRVDGGKPRLALLDLWRKKVAYDDLELAVQDVWAKWSKGGSPAEVHIEDKASGQTLLQTLGNRTSIPLFPWKGPTGASKESRAEDALPPFRAGLVLLPASAPWVAAWIDEHTGFPGAAFNDQVDTTSMAVSVLYSRLTAPAAAAGDTVADYANRDKSDSLAGAYGARRGRLIG